MWEDEPEEERQQLYPTNEALASSSDQVPIDEEDQLRIQ
jgi:hypothetical protein